MLLPVLLFGMAWALTNGNGISGQGFLVTRSSGSGSLLPHPWAVEHVETIPVEEEVTPCQEDLVPCTSLCHYRRLSLSRSGRAGLCPSTRRPLALRVGSVPLGEPSGRDGRSSSFRGSPGGRPSRAAPLPKDARAPAQLGLPVRSGGRPLVRMLGRPLSRPDPGASAADPAPRSGRPAPRHDGSLLRPPGHHLHHVLGPHRHRRALVRAQRTQPRSDHHHAGSHCCLLLPLLAHRHPGPAEPAVWATAEERDHLVCALPVGVTAAALAQVPRLSG